MAVTRKDIIKNDKFMETLADYGFRRNGDVYASQEEAVDSFLEDYRAVQANTISTAKFMNFVSNGISVPPAEVIKIFINYFNISFIDSIFSLLMFFAAFFPIILKKYFNGIHLFLE